MMFSVKNGCFGYRASKPVLRDVSLNVRSGEVLCVLGPNGVGKTTLLKCMMGMLAWNKGASYLDDKKLSDYSQREIWKRIAYVPQAKGSAFAFTAREMVLMGRSSHINMLSQPSREDLVKAEEAMESCGITYLSDKKCTEMSGGELHMVLIARALAAEPQMLVFDEPESNLDFKNQLVVLQTIKSLAKEHGLCAIVNTHYPEHALRIADRALLLRKDGSNESGPIGEMITSDKLRKTFGVNVHIQHFTVDGVEYHDVVPLSLAVSS